MKQLPNAIDGLLDYAAYPVGMLAVVPTILRNLGVGQYGLWAVVTSVVSLGSIVESGLGDALIQNVANRRGTGSRKEVLQLVRGAMGIYLLLGLATGSNSRVFSRQFVPSKRFALARKELLSGTGPRCESASQEGSQVLSRQPMRSRIR